jgi:SpoVK/Ycf46/Vps4 family AAA+-type ATPase
MFGPGEMPPHRLSAEQLRLVGMASRALGGDVPAAMRRLAAGTIDATAMRIHPGRTWEDLVLDAPRADQVREVARRCRHRETVFGEWGFAPEPSVGVVALFAGPSGTGKTLAAEVIAADLGVDLYKIDLANLVSKYIGETEKNLARVFDAAEAANVALFFDEADALMGKRSAVSDAHDRYANIEVAYLLQRLERYEGLAVLATNLANNIDPAFVRRFHVVVEFPIPGPAERRRIWDRCLPSLAPLGRDVDLDRLAKDVEVPGGTIRNAALGAAFLAADEGHPITMDTLVRAMQREMHKIGRLITSSDIEGLGAASLRK